MDKLKYQLSTAAAEDLERLYEWGIDVFGEKAADQYFDGLMTRLSDIADHPLRWPAIDHIRSGYRRSVYFAHSIFFASLILAYWLSAF